MKKLIVVIFLCFVNIFVYAQDVETGIRYNEELGGYSICPPKSWQVIEIPGFKYHGFAGPVINGFAPNMNFVEEQYSAPVKEYVDLNLAQMRQLFSGFILVSRSRFSTDSHLQGERIVIINEQYSIKLKQTFYFFTKESAKMIITFTVPVEGGEFYDAIFDGSVKTFRW